MAVKVAGAATETGLEVTSRAIQIVGGRGAYTDYPLERAFRDLRTSTLMPPSVARMLEGIGKSALGLETGMFNVAIEERYWPLRRRRGAQARRAGAPSPRAFARCPCRDRSRRGTPGSSARRWAGCARLLATRRRRRA